MKIVDMTCPKCGAVLKTDGEKEKAFCEYCGASFLIDNEDSLEEITEKAKSKAYGYYKGRMKAKQEAKEQASKLFRNNSSLIPVMVLGGFILIGCFSMIVSELAKPKVNPYDCITVSFRGIDGEGEIMVEKSDAMGGIDLNLIELDISKEDYLSQGETISIKASSEEYRLTEKNKLYTVDGLDEYLKDLDNIPQDAMEIIHMKAESALSRNLETSKELGYFVEMKPVKIFLATDGKQTNELYDVFEVRFDTDYGMKTYYVLAYFYDVVIRDVQQVSIDMSYGTYWGNLTQIQGPLYIMAYDSIDEIRVEILTSQDSYLELKELDL